MMERWSRRKFLAATAGLAAIPATEGFAAPKIPRRPLGKTGMQVSILGLGGGSQFLSACKNDDEAVEMLTLAIEGGINYLDCAASYGNGESERRFGLVVPKRRAELYLTSKTLLRDRDGALREIERSLKNMRTDYLDVMQLHLIRPDEDLDAFLGPNSAYRALVKLKEEKVIRAIGITGHLAAQNMRELVRRMEVLDTVLCPVNPAKDSRHFVSSKDPNNPDGHFEELLLPEVRKRGLGIIAMKTTAQGTLVGEGRGKADALTLIRYAMSEPGVATAVVGPGSLANLKANIAMAQNYRPMPEAERKQLALHIGSVPHRFAYHDPEYRDA